MYLSVELDPVATPKPVNRPIHFLKVVALSVVVLLAMGVVIVPLIRLIAIDPHSDFGNWGALIRMYGIMAALICFVPMLFISQELRWKRWDAAVQRHYTEAKKQAWGWHWVVLGAERREDFWVIDCGYGRLLRRIKVAQNDLEVAPLDHLARLRFGDVQLELPRYDYLPIRLTFGGPVILDCLPDELPPLREDYVSSLS